MSGHDNDKKEVLELIESCQQYISGRREIAGEFCAPYSPALLVMLGNACQKENLDQVKETIRLGWGSLHEYIKYLEYSKGIAYEQLIEDADREITAMKMASVEVFQSFNNTKIFIFLDLSDKNIEQYMEFFHQKNSLSEDIVGDDQVILFVMLDETDRKNETRTYAYIREIMELKKKDRIAGAVFFSTQLRSGRVLSMAERSMNYRIAADIVFVSNSRDILTGNRFEVSRNMESDILGAGQVCTAAYIKQSKPSEAIAKIILRAMVELHVENEAEIIQNPQFDRSKYEFYKRLKTNDKEGILGLERLYEETIKKNFPGSVLYRYLPYSEELEKHKGDFASVNEVLQLLSHQARNVLRTTEWHHFMKYIENYINENCEQLLSQIESTLERTIPYMEFLEYCQKKEQLEEIRRELEGMSFIPAVRAVGGGASAEQLLWNNSCASAREYFYKKMGGVCLEAFDRYLDKASHFKVVVKTTQTYLNQGFVDQYREKFYRSLIRTKLNYSEHRKDYQRVCASVGEWCIRLRSLFQELINEYPKELDTTFEEEQKLILDANPTAAIMEQLGFKNQRLTDECRLEYGNTPTGNCYCLAYAGAEFVDEIRNQEKDMGALFTSSRQDCAERLMICPFSCDNHHFDGYKEVPDEDL